MEISYDDRATDLGVDVSEAPLTKADLKRMKRTPRVSVVRRALGYTQEEFSECFHIPIGTLRDWEQGRREPDQASQNYIHMIATDPEGVLISLGTLPKGAKENVHRRPGYFGIERVWFVYRESRDAAYQGSMLDELRSEDGGEVIDCFANEERASRLAMKYAIADPGVAYGIGFWDMSTPQTAVTQWRRCANGEFKETHFAEV